MKGYSNTNCILVFRFLIYIYIYIYIYILHLSLKLNGLIHIFELGQRIFEDYPI
jgi:hypothetical protein